MKTGLLALLLLFSCVAPAQTPRPQRPPEGGMNMGMPDLSRLGTGMLDQWWKDPDIASELHLTEAQKEKLDKASMQMKLAAIDATAGAAKSFLMLQDQLGNDTIDETIYNQQLGDLSGAVQRLIRDVGQSMLMIRKTLTADQWHQLQRIQRRRGPNTMRAPQPEHPEAPPR